MMSGRVLLLFEFALLVSWAKCQETTIPTAEPMKTCPFPVASSLIPCSCKVDQGYNSFLICDINQDMDADVWETLNKAFACKKEAHTLDVNLNGHKWLAGFSQDMLGQFKIIHFHLSNFSSLEENIKPGAFNGSSSTLQTVNIESSVTDVNSMKEVESEAFSKLHALRSVKLGNSFQSIKTKAFSDLPNLHEFSVAKASVAILETEAFEQIPKLDALDLSGQKLENLVERTFSNLNLTTLDLSHNMIKKLPDIVFNNLPSLQNLDLSMNLKFCHLGKLLDHLPHPNLGVNLSSTNVKVLLQESLKTFVGRVGERGGRGFLDFDKVPLQCGCDVKWLGSARPIIQNSYCQDGTSLQEVDRQLLDAVCPPESCPGYDSGYGRNYGYIQGPPSDHGVLSSPNFPSNYYDNANKNYKIEALGAPIKITFSRFNTEAGYDKVSIVDGNGEVLLPDTSGTSIPPITTSRTNIVYVKFRTDAGTRRSGWQLRWKGGMVMNTDENQFCEGCA